MRLYRYITLIIVLLVAVGFVYAVNSSKVNARAAHAVFSLTGQKHLLSDNDDPVPEFDLTATISGASQHGADKRGSMRVAVVSLLSEEVIRNIFPLSSIAAVPHSRYLRLLFPFHNFW